MLSMLRGHVPAGYSILLLVQNSLDPFALYPTKSESGGHDSVLVLKMLSGPLGWDKDVFSHSPLRRMLPPGGGQRLRCILLRMQTVLSCFMCNGN